MLRGRPLQFPIILPEFLQRTMTLTSEGASSLIVLILKPCTGPFHGSLRMYNSLVEKCFKDCVESFRRKDLDSTEEKVSSAGNTLPLHAVCCGWRSYVPVLWCI